MDIMRWLFGPCHSAVCAPTTKNIQRIQAKDIMQLSYDGEHGSATIGCHVHQPYISVRGVKNIMDGRIMRVSKVSNYRDFGRDMSAIKIDATEYTLS